MAKKKKYIAVALALWILGAVWLASKSVDALRNGAQAGGVDDALSLQRIMFPSLMQRDQD